MDLRTYQQDDINKMLQNNCSACFNEQRTGKTPIAITTMERRALDKVLVVCPASMLYPWQQAWKQWADKDAVVCTGTLPKRIEIIEHWTHGPMIVSYGCLKETKRSTGLVDYILKKHPEGCIADEAHHFKDHTTAVASAMYRLIKIPYRLALTGTPATNKPQDIYGILHWLRPYEYNSYWRFIRENFRTYTQYTGFNKHHIEVGAWLPGRKEYIAAQLNQFSTQRKRKDVMQWLPNKDYTNIILPPTASTINIWTN